MHSNADGQNEIYTIKNSEQKYPKYSHQNHIILRIFSLFIEVNKKDYFPQILHLPTRHLFWMLCQFLASIYPQLNSLSSVSNIFLS